MCFVFIKRHSVTNDFRQLGYDDMQFLLIIHYGCNPLLLSPPLHGIQNILHDSKPAEEIGYNF